MNQTQEQNPTPGSRLVVLEGYDKPAGYQRFVIYEENSEGRFVSARSRFSGLVIDDMESLGDSLGIITPAPYQKELAFQSPVVVDSRDRRNEARSIYSVLRANTDSRRKRVILALPHSNPSRGELELRPINYKPSVSMAKRSLIFSRWLQTLNLDLDRAVT